MAPGPWCSWLCSYFYSTSYFQFRLEELPDDLTHQVLQYLPKDSLANLRLASRVLQERATTCLYRRFTLRYTPASVAKAREVMNRPYLAQLVREFQFDANPSEWSVAASSPDNILLQVRQVFQDLRSFYRICAFSISFGRTTTGRLPGEEHAWDVYSTAFLYLLEPSAPVRLDGLSMEKAPTHIAHHVATSPVFLELLRNLRVLDFDIITLEPDRIPPLSRRSIADAARFHSKFPQIWLAPASPNLRVLHLSADAPWGWHPKADFRGINFPQLEELLISRFNFSHDWQLQWLVDHADSLKRLRLIDCTILHHAMAMKYGLDLEGYPLQARQRPEESTLVKASYRYKSRWSDYFKTIATSLPHLQSFSLFAPGHVYKSTSRFPVLDEEGDRASRYDRYAVFASACYTPLFTKLPSIFPGGEERFQQDKDDAQGFVVLMATVWLRCRRRKLGHIPSVTQRSR